MSKIYKALMVDDDKFLLSMYAKKFKNSGIEVELAASTSEALVKLRDNPDINILLLDIIMPNMDGLELLKKIRVEKLIPNADVIMLTNEGDFARITEAQALGISSYLIKASYTPSEVVDQVFRIVNLKVSNS
jgi:CheY-like chemotaxis protein